MISYAIFRTGYVLCLQSIKALLQLSNFLNICLRQWTLVILLTCLTTSCESPLMINFLIPNFVAILSPARSPSYSAVLLVACSREKCIWTTYFKCSQVGATRSTLAPAPCSGKEPSKYMIHSWGASLPGMTVSGISSSGVGVHSAINSASALLRIVD